MSRYTGPRNRLARREGVDLGLKTPGSAAHSQLLRRLKIPPGQHGQKRARKVSDYGSQLREKQKVKRMYGIGEKQFENYYKAASNEKGNTGEALLTLLERRLDNIVYRLHLSPTRSAARQFVTHGHVKVDNKKVDIPSFLVQKEMVVTLTQKILETPLLKKTLEDTTAAIPAWLQKKGPVGKVIRLPERPDLTEPIDEQLIIEFYSR